MAWIQPTTRSTLVSKDFRKGQLESPSSVALRMAGTYAIVGIAYIMLSDWILAAMIENADKLTHLQTAKGWAFILFTAMLVYFMARRYGSEVEASQQRLQQSEQEYRRIVETANEGIAMVDATGMLTWVNARLTAMLGYANEELIGMSMLNVVDGESRQALASKLDLRSPATAQAFDVKLAGKDRREVWAIVALSPLYEADCYVGSLAMLTDISERKRLEMQLTQFQKMEAVGQLAGGVAHDFNNIVTAILGNVDLMRLQMKRQPLPMADIAQDIEQIERAGERAMALTRQLLTFSRRQVVKTEIVQPDRLLSEMEKMLRRLIREDIDLRIAVVPDIGTVRADTGQLEQVIVNLVVNARDAMPRGGKLIIEATNTVLDAGYVARHADAAAGPHVVIAVSDTGEGIDAKVLPRIFEPFFTTKPAGQGTGLGLATVYGIVKRFGGHITVYSEANIGTTFKIFLPVTLGEVTGAAPRKSGEALTGGSETLLICEDDESIRQLMCRMLSERGYRVLAADNPANALSIVARHTGPLDLLVTDVVMGGMNGRQLAELVKCERPNLKVLFISGYTSNVIEHHGVLDDGVEFMQKPFTADDLTRRVREVLDGPVG